MTTVTLTSITCISTMNNSGDAIFLLVNDAQVATLLFGGAATKPFTSPITVNANDFLELVVKNNKTGIREKMGRQTAAASSSAITYRLASAHYGLNFV